MVREKEKKINVESRFHYVFYFKMFGGEDWTFNETLYMLNKQERPLFVMPTTDNFG